MKTLRAFWHWVDNENPDAADVPARARKNLSKVALEALVSAASLVTARALPMCDWDADGPLRYALERHRPILRDVSLKLCEALELLHGAIAELPVHTFVTQESAPFRMEYLMEWIPPQMVTETFRGVDRSRDEDRRLSGVRVPQSFKLPPQRHVDEYCPCLKCVAARVEAASQVQALGIEAQQYMVATHDGLVPFDPAATQQPSEQQRNEYEQRALAIQAVDATHPRNQCWISQVSYLRAFEV